MKMLLTMLVAIALPSLADAQNRVYSPARGSVERNAMMDALRGPVTRALRGPVIFTDVQIRAVDGWAFVQATPTSPRGEPLMDRYRMRIGDDNLTDTVLGLLRWDGRAWIVTVAEIGSTEYPYRWERQYGAPRRIFPWNQRL